MGNNSVLRCLNIQKKNISCRNLIFRSLLVITISLSFLPYHAIFFSNLLLLKNTYTIRRVVDKMIANKYLIQLICFLIIFVNQSENIRRNEHTKNHLSHAFRNQKISSTNIRNSNRGINLH